MRSVCSLALQVDGVEQLVSGEGPPDFRLPATLQQYVEHGGCLFKVKGNLLPRHSGKPARRGEEALQWCAICRPGRFRSENQSGLPAGLV